MQWKSIYQRKFHLYFNLAEWFNFWFSAPARQGQSIDHAPCGFRLDVFAGFCFCCWFLKLCLAVIRRSALETTNPRVIKRCDSFRLLFPWSWEMEKCTNIHDPSAIRKHSTPSESSLKTILPPPWSSWQARIRKSSPPDVDVVVGYGESWLSAKIRSSGGRLRTLKIRCFEFVYVRIWVWEENFQIFAIERVKLPTDWSAAFRWRCLFANWAADRGGAIHISFSSSWCLSETQLLCTLLDATMVIVIFMFVSTAIQSWVKVRWIMWNHHTHGLWRFSIAAICRKIRFHTSFWDWIGSFTLQCVHEEGKFPIVAWL